MTAITLLAPQRLWFLVALAPLVLAYVLLQAQRKRYAVRFTNLELLDSVAPRRPGWRRHVVAIAALAAAVTLVISLARPARREEIPRERGIVMVAIDVSYSMTATDVEPSRIAAATEAARDFVEGMPPSLEVGVVAFDGNARVLASPTDDHDIVVSSIDRLAPGQATAAGEGIFAALEAIASALPEDAGKVDATDPGKPPATIVLLSDGATTTGRPVEEASAAAAQARIPITTIAYGTPTGIIERAGEIVPVPADTATMEAVAESTGGTAFTAASADELRAVYENIQGQVGHDTETREIGRFFVAVGIVLLLAAVMLSMLWSGRFV